ncbi:uncharacterized protein LOC109708563 isoform X1 [Ananas comosus]|uniref:Uncharacterized protein LOC109708563 isoform X1 n=2 Tax=Ananas comosus TaxID=4615 RepID=A0A6P5EQY3_ANACO|nr:uncharacterized protein LOC109708563 isoform X1 [Ananas comosus]
MGDLGLLKQLWNWVYSQRQAFTGFRSCVREKLIVLVDRHWPTVYRVCLNVGRFLWTVLLQWKDCALGGFWSLISLGSVALFVTMWSCFLCLTSMNCLVYALLSVIAAGVTIRYLGYTPGLFIVGLFAILIMWIYGNFWMTGTLLIGGGYMFSLNHARLAILISTTYALYCVNARSGWLGIFLVLNVSSLSNYLLNVLLQGCDAPTENVNLDDEKESESEPVMEECSKNCEYSPSTSEPEHVTSSKASCTTPTPTVSHTQKEAASSEVVRSDSASLEEITRIMTSSTHYEVLGFLLNKVIDPKFLKKEYRRKVLLVHPDKNMGNPLACESFKKLQCAYEVLSDLTKKNSYDEQLRKEEARRVSQKSCGISQKGGGEFISEESRRIQCTKCGNFHTWICTCRSKARARWCQDCSQFHLAKDGDGWVENNRSPFFSTSQKVDIPRAFVCAESKIFDVSEWAICQGVVCRPNTHRPSFMVNMVGLDNTTNRANSSRYPWGLDAEMIAEEDEFDLWLQQALASGLFSETPKRRKSWSPFKIHQKGIKHWRRSP